MRNFLIVVFFSFVFTSLVRCNREVVTSTPAQSTPSNSQGKSPSYQSALADVAFIGTHAWATDRSGTTLYHTDTGNSMEKTATNFGGEALISFLDTKTGFAFAHSVGLGRLWRTTDGGQHWQKVTEFDQTIEDFHVTVPRQLHFADGQHGWLVGAFGVWRTQDGGAHWQKVFKMADHPEVEELVQAAFASAETAIIATTSGVYLSVDGGKSWKSTNKNTGLTAIYFLDEHSGWAWSDRVVRTDDGGNTWRELYNFRPRGKIMSTQFINKEEGWATGVEVPESFGSSARNASSPQWYGILLHTKDGGSNWDHASAPADDVFLRVAFSDFRNGWLLGMNRLYRTTDGGSTWSMVLEVQTP
jgi:photosystem II stability/assembly factor-like uncharacterized protein